MKEEIVRGVHRGALLLKKYSPEILLGAGIVGGIGATILACKATRKVDRIIENHNQEMAKIDKAVELMAGNDFPAGDMYTNDDKVKDQTITYVQTGVELLKLYGPALGLGVASIGCVLFSHGIMKKRQVAIVAAYNVVAASYKNLLKKVEENYGGGAKAFLDSGVEENGEVETNTTEEGKITSKKAKQTPHFRKSAYAVYFDATSVQYRETLDQNLFFLQCQQNYANDLLFAHGHVFLNEIYDALGLPRTKEGACVGWVYSKNNERGDNFVIFDLHHMDNLDGTNIDGILVDFNPDGVILDLI